MLKKKWLPEFDSILQKKMQKYGQAWSKISKQLKEQKQNFGFSGKQCRNRAKTIKKKQKWSIQLENKMVEFIANNGKFGQFSHQNHMFENSAKSHFHSMMKKFIRTLRIIGFEKLSLNEIQYKIDSIYPKVCQMTINLKKMRSDLRNFQDKNKIMEDFRKYIFCDFKNQEKQKLNIVIKLRKFPNKVKNLRDYYTASVIDCEISCLLFRDIILLNQQYKKQKQQAQQKKALNTVKSEKNLFSNIFQYQNQDYFSQDQKIFSKNIIKTCQNLDNELIEKSQDSNQRDIRSQWEIDMQDAKRSKIKRNFLQQFGDFDDQQWEKNDTIKDPIRAKVFSCQNFQNANSDYFGIDLQQIQQD